MKLSRKQRKKARETRVRMGLRWQKLQRRSVCHDFDAHERSLVKRGRVRRVKYSAFVQMLALDLSR
jgi:hypothetical protein